MLKLKNLKINFIWDLRFPDPVLHSSFIVFQRFCEINLNMCYTKFKDGCIMEILELKTFFQSPHRQIFSHTRPISQPMALPEAEHARSHHFCPASALGSNKYRLVRIARSRIIKIHLRQWGEARPLHLFFIHSATNLQTNQVRMTVQLLNSFSF